MSDQTSAAPSASAARLRDYRRDGFLVVHDQILGDSAFTRLKAIFEEHLTEHGAALFNELDMPHARDPRLLDILLSDALLDLAEPITGPDIMLWSSGFICKLPEIGPSTPWHADSAYWEGRLDSYEDIVTIWLALDSASKANGCLRVIPGSHLFEPARYEEVDPDAFFDRQATQVDENAAVYLELEPGECSLHDGRILHGATANTSPFRRAGYTMRYLPTRTRLLPGANDGHPVWLARGRAIAPNRYVNA
jgi:hypothetical protein